jgi:DNA mismatch repair ATPase MutL
LLQDFQSEDALGHCPHGRPTFFRLQSRDFEKMFQRVV